MLDAGDRAPDFSLPNQSGGKTSLIDYQDKWVVVWWIPSTMQEITPPCCDAIAKGFGAQVAAYSDLNVVGLSFDTPEQMRIFAQRALIAFPLLADETKEVGEAFGVRRGEGKDWDSFPLKRAFLVNPAGVIEKRYDNIDPDFFVPEVISDLVARDAIIARDVRPLAWVDGPA